MNWTDLKRESGLILTKKSVVFLLFVAFALSAFSVWTGTQEVEKQRETISRLIDADRIDRAEVLEQKTGYGSVAYYAFSLTYDPPSNLAFAGLGSRDSYPWKHRIRALALEGQIYESDTGNPEMAMAGRIDFTFVISILAPLITILLLHDIRAAERASGRYALLVVSARRKFGLWLPRTVSMVSFLSLALLIPFWIGAVWNGALAIHIVLVSLITILHIALWAALCYWFDKKDSSAPHLASALLGLWLVSSFVLPALGSVAIERMFTGPQGGEILMTQREAVNGAWELPFETTMDAFTARHPEWKPYTKMDSLWDWKWYYAFQQTGDQAAEPLSLAYREVAKQKYEAASWLSVLSPASWVSRSVTRLAETDPVAAWHYEQQVRDYHESLRKYFYPYLFKATAFDRSELSKMPVFAPEKSN